MNLKVKADNWGGRDVTLQFWGKKYPQRIYMHLFLIIEQPKKTPVYLIRKIYLKPPLYQTHFPTTKYKRELIKFSPGRIPQHKKYRKAWYKFVETFYCLGVEYCAKQPLMSKKYLKSSKDVQGNGFPLQSLESYAKLTYSWLFLIEWVESKIYITVQSRNLF